MNNYYTTEKLQNDGFGSQYQKRILTYIYCKIHNLTFLYNPLIYVEHNYDNDNDYNNKLENLMNLKNNINNVKENIKIDFLNYNQIIKWFENNIDYFCQSEHMGFIKKCFWENKSTDFFNNNKINVAIHIRRENKMDKGLAGERATTPNSYYLNVMNRIRDKYKNDNKEILFHIYSQGSIESFKELDNNDVKFYLNHDIIETFIGMVAANILVISPSSLSYVAALISDGEIYYKKFWHNQRKEWIIV
jgi:hypothetical protein